MASSERCTAHVRLGPRIVRCPICGTVLIEPGTEIYECPKCSTYLRAKRTQSNSQKQLSRGPSNEKNDDTDSAPQGGDEPNNGDMGDYIPKDSGSRQQRLILKAGNWETMLISGSERGEDSQLQSKSAASLANMDPTDSANQDIPTIGEECKTIRMQTSLDCTINEVASTGNEDQSVDAEEVSKDNSMKLKSSSEGCDTAITQILPEGAIPCNIFVGECECKDMGTSVVDYGMPRSGTEENLLTVKCVGVKETYQAGCNISNDKNDPKFESEIARDTDCELSFKYISSSLRSNHQLDKKKRAHGLAGLLPEAFGSENQVPNRPGFSVTELPSSSNEDSDEYETNSSFSESASQDGSDSGFGFPAPSAENIQLEKLSQTFLHKKEPSSHGAPEASHRLEWQDNNIKPSILQDSNGLTISSDRVTGKIDSGGALAEDGLYSNRGLAKKNASEGLDDTMETARNFACVQEKNDLSGFKNQTNTGGMVAPRSSNECLVIGAVSGVQVDFPDKEGTSVDLLHEQHNTKPSIEAGYDKSSGILSSGTEHVLQLKPCSTLQVQMHLLTTEPSTISSSDLSQVNTNIALKDSYSVSLPEYAVDTTEDADQEKDLYTLNSGGHHQRDHPHIEDVQVHHKEAAKMLDAEVHRKMNSLSDRAQAFHWAHAAPKSSTYQSQEKILNEETYASREARSGKSVKMEQGYVQAASVIHDPSLQLQNPQVDLHRKEQPIHSMEGQPFRSNDHINRLESFANAACSYQVTSHPLILPMGMAGHRCSHDTCQPVTPVCMPYVHCQHYRVLHPYVHCQHSHALQLHMPSCVLCSRTVGHHQEHTELGHYHQGHQVQAPHLLCHCPTHFSPRFVNMHDTSMAAAKPLMSPRRKPKHYPPLPQGKSAPYVACRRCRGILQVPADLYPSNGAIQKLRCSACGKVSKFTLLERIEKSETVSLQAPTVGSSNKASQSSPPSIKFMVQNRELPVPNIRQNVEPLHVKSLHSQYEQGSISAHHNPGSRVVVNDNNVHQSLQADLTFKTNPSKDKPDTEIPSAIDSHSSQDEFFFRILSRKSEFDSSRGLFDGFKTMPSRFNSVCNDDPVGNGDLPLQCTVDEKEEGLDFGAPRPSDGESLDPESRMRSPENFKSVDQPRHRRHSFGDEEAWASKSEQQFGPECSNTAQERRPNTPLITLLNQESPKFVISMEESIFAEETTSELGFPTSNSPIRSQKYQESKASKYRARPHNPTTQGLMRKGSRYIATMLTRSLRNRVQ